jgi:hypothetical protein
MSPSSIATALLLLVVDTSAFASKEARKSRPSDPELAQSRGDARKERLPWNAMRFMKQSSKLVSANPFPGNSSLRGILKEFLVFVLVVHDNRMHQCIALSQSQSCIHHASRCCSRQPRMEIKARGLDSRVRPQGAQKETPRLSFVV